MQGRLEDRHLRWPSKTKRSRGEGLITGCNPTDSSLQQWLILGSREGPTHQRNRRLGNSIFYLSIFKIFPSLGILHIVILHESMFCSMECMLY
ncbi:hypothetical protein MA16_Dca024397 [Dendrobium catenatum]|uniref:Uncharacterized protein n=1 Tax=Dendrobium catenatum TaxID=906689 RepID=A0A2I0VP56_9ASPA|nr:hypothetical protein MA16_Dca024397 [Dendrobium catenatum]